MLKTLIGLGLKQVEAKIYIFLAKQGSHKALDIRKALKLTKQQLYPCLKNLESKGIVSATLENPARFSAIPFENLLDLFIETKIEETRHLQKSKEEILSNWQNLSVVESETSAKFTVIEGRSYIFSRIQQMFQKAKSQILAITTVPGLLQADQIGLFDAELGQLIKSEVKFRFLAELSTINVSAVKKFMVEAKKAQIRIEGRNPDLGLKLFPKMVIKDETEALFFIKSKASDSIVEQDDVCLWTNCKPLVKAFIAIFGELWRNSTDIRRKIKELEMGKPTSKSLIIEDVEVARGSYEKALRSAEKEIIMLTSPESLSDFWKNCRILEECFEKGVSIKIMAPIVKQNYEEAEQILKFCEVRHVPLSYAGTTIIDKKHLFKFKVSENQGNCDSMHFENTFYTNDIRYVEKMNNVLMSIWKNALAPSTNKPGLMFGPFSSVSLPPEQTRMAKEGDAQLIEVKPEGVLTEKEVLNRIIHPQKISAKDPSKDAARLFASMAMVVIHPPDYLNLPDLMIQAAHAEKQSTYGSGDYLIVFLWLDTPKGKAFVPVAFVADDCFKGKDFMKFFFAGSPAAQNVQIFKKDELEVRVHGTTLFVGWTVPIRLFPPRYILPPACLLVEGYGKVKTAGTTMLHPSGFKSEMEGNFFDAFVTFMHPESKYSGPGTDGFFAREFIMTQIPPEKH
jgi:sugar-specific transcriptional regulator TrmB